MTVESNYATAALCDWLNNHAPVFQPMRRKTNCTLQLYARFSPALSKLQVIAKNSDCFIALFAPVVIGQSQYFVIGFSVDSHLKTVLNNSFGFAGLFLKFSIS